MFGNRLDSCAKHVAYLEIFFTGSRSDVFGPYWICGLNAGVANKKISINANSATWAACLEIKHQTFCSQVIVIVLWSSFSPSPTPRGRGSNVALGWSDKSNNAAIIKLLYFPLPPLASKQAKSTEQKSSVFFQQRVGEKCAWVFIR